MKDPYEGLTFENVSNIVELAEVFVTGPYKDNGLTTEHETYTGIMEQYNNAPRNNYENAAMVMYIDRTRQDSEKIVEMKSMWFDEDGNKTARPVRKPDGE